MFTVHLWDTEKYQSLFTIEDYKTNELFLIATDKKLFPLLSELATCEDDVFSGNQLIQLHFELSMLKRNQSHDLCE